MPRAAMVEILELADQDGRIAAHPVRGKIEIGGGQRAAHSQELPGIVDHGKRAVTRPRAEHELAPRGGQCLAEVPLQQRADAEQGVGPVSSIVPGRRRSQNH